MYKSTIQTTYSYMYNYSFKILSIYIFMNNSTIKKTCSYMYKTIIQTTYSYIRVQYKK